ncbi:putative acyltransferase [Holospora elegans E1]|uniref:Putative acyltransferase n=1 Tax=Holospora elegans E1 TaxID=1427503 RepID=A0A023DWL3_9PROT|nr:lysophospholipid acyltransferase family protein [Holospora elegans]GAJ45823.1 putative acyltransferase [Holospora elegans E1]
MGKRGRFIRFLTLSKRIFFHLCFYMFNFFVTFLGALTLPFLYMGPTSWIYKVAQWWCRCLLANAQKYLGISWKIKELPYVQSSSIFLIACAHQSAWETLILTTVFRAPAFVLKNTLMEVPVLGWFFRRMGMIPIHRGKIISKTFIRKAQDVLEQERSIVIFPEGKRVPFGKPVRCHRGIFFLYKTFNLPVLALSLNSGFFWPPRRFFKISGCIEMQGHPLIEPGLDEETFLSTLCTLLQKGNENLAKNIQNKHFSNI